MTSLAAQRPPVGLPGLDPAWSRLVTCPDSTGADRTWHLLDSFADRTDAPRVTMLCVHGNPTWSYLWRDLLAAAPSDVRVIAVDQLDMGFSERTGVRRTLGDRVEDLDLLTRELGLTGPVITVAHDWGGPVSMGWVLRNRDLVLGSVLLNTALSQPTDDRPPMLISMARFGALRSLVTERTSVFTRSPSVLARSQVTSAEAAAYAAPYATPERRRAVEQFVADIPLEDDHPSGPVLDAIADGVRDLDTPVLLLWGANDPVFSDRYLRDLEERMPHAQVHRYDGAGHLTIEEADGLVDDLLLWVDDVTSGTRVDLSAADDAAPADVREPLLGMFAASGDGAEAPAGSRVPTGTAIVEPADAGWRHVTWTQLDRAVCRLSGALRSQGVTTGERVAVLVPPSAELVALAYAIWSLGASIVVVDGSMGVRAMNRALRSADPAHIVTIPRGRVPLLAGGLQRRAIAWGELKKQAASVDCSSWTGATPPAPTSEAVVAFTSGATGPAKGVVYTYDRIARTRDLLREHYGLGGSDGLIAAFPPWMLLGPALGLPTVLPRMNLTDAGSLTAAALADAARELPGTVLWASPAALRAVLGSSSDLDATQLAALGSIRLALGAGAPISRDLLIGLQSLLPQASLRTPYGMTEVLPVAEADATDILAAGRGQGVLVGAPLDGVTVRISAVDGEGRAGGTPTADPDVLGEVLVSAAHGKAHYDRRWGVERRASRDAGFHRTGDVGHLDTQGRLWIEGRLAHVITTTDGPIGPVGLEEAVQELPAVRQAAAVGIGPIGDQQVVIVVTSDVLPSGLASLDVLDAVRATVDVPVAAVLVRRTLPVDIRHRSKVDRAALAAEADRILRGSG